MLHSGHHTEEKHEEFKRQCLDIADGSNFDFAQPPLGINPKEFVETHFGKGSNAKTLQFRKGTTTLAFVYEPLTEKDTGGIVVAVDSRASAGGYIASKTVMKILHINDQIVGTMAGGAADCQFWMRVVAKYCSLYELREKCPISVRAASKYMASVLYQYRGQGLSVGSMIAGYDKSGPSIFSVNSEGSRIPLKICSVGSGSLAAYGILDTFYKPKMTDEEALKLGRRAIMHATYRDAGSGGFCNVVHIKPTGKVIYPPVDVSELYYEFASEIGRELFDEVKDDE